MKAFHRRLISAAIVLAGVALVLGLALTLGPSLSNSSPGTEFREGQDYFVIDSDASVDADSTSITARLFFWYGCGACYQLHSAFSEWAERNAHEINWISTPAVFGLVHERHARLHYSILKLGINVETGMNTVYRTIHQERNQLLDDKSIIELLGKLGATSEDARKVLDSYMVTQQVREARDITRSMRIPATPTLVIHERYLINSSMPVQRIVATADYLIQYARTQRAAKPASKPTP